MSYQQKKFIAHYITQVKYALAGQVSTQLGAAWIRHLQLRGVQSRVPAGKQSPKQRHCFTPNDILWAPVTKGTQAVVSILDS